MMTINVHVLITKLAGEKPKYRAECDAFAYSSEADSIGVAFVAVVKKLTEISKDIHWSITMGPLRDEGYKMEVVGEKDAG